jgi:hypothetical protein
VGTSSKSLGSSPAGDDGRGSKEEGATVASGLKLTQVLLTLGRCDHTISDRVLDSPVEWSSRSPGDREVVEPQHCRFGTHLLEAGSYQQMLQRSADLGVSEPADAMLTHSLEYVVVARPSDVSAVIRLYDHDSAPRPQQPHHLLDDRRRRLHVDEHTRTQAASNCAERRPMASAAQH